MITLLSQESTLDQNPSRIRTRRGPEPRSDREISKRLRSGHANEDDGKQPRAPPGCKPEGPAGLKRFVGGNPRHDVMRCVICHADGCQCSHYEHDSSYCVTLKTCRACDKRGDHWTAECPDIALLDEPPLGTYVTSEDLIRWAAKD